MYFIGPSLVNLSACTEVVSSSLPEDIAGPASAFDYRRIADFYVERPAKYEANVVWHEEAISISFALKPRGDSLVTMEHCLALEQRLSAATKKSRNLVEAHHQLAVDAK